MTNVPPNTLLPLVLSGQLAQVVGADVHANIVISGLPFMLHPSQQDPYLRQCDEDQKQQFDDSHEAGENSFGQWWLRSQATFHGGQGQNVLDSSDPTISRIRFHDSRYMAPFSPGEVTLAGTVTSAANTRNGAVQVTWSGVQKLVTMSTTTFQVNVANLPSLSGASTINVGGTGVPTAMTDDGTNVYVAINDKIYRIDSTGTATNTHNLTFSGPVVMGFAKQRLIVCVGNKVYELDPNPVSPPVTVTTPHYTNPSTGYVYTSVAEGPNGIYLAGHSGPASDIASMSVTESSGTVVLGPPVVQLKFPPAEIVQALFFYVSSLFAVATSNGVRVGSFTPYGQPQIGSLLIKGTSCHSLTGSGTLIWVGADDSIWWVDLSTPIDQVGGYAHAKLADGLGATAADYVSAIVVYPGTNDLVFGTTSTGRLISQPTFTQSSTGTLTTSWARFSTVERKQLHYLTIEGNDPAGTVTVENNEGDTVSFTLDGSTCCYEFSTAGLPAGQSFRITVSLTAGTLRSYQFKALPVPRRFRTIILPLQLSDEETPVDGPPVGYPGYAKDRLIALEGIAEANTRITVVDNIMGVSYQAVIQKMQFVQDESPAETNGLGGIVNVVLKLV